MNYAELFNLALPEALVAITALVVLLVDLVSMRDQPRQARNLVLGAFAGVGCLAAMGWMLTIPTTGHAAGGLLAIDPLSQFIKVLLLAMTLFTILISWRSSFTDHVGEYFALLLFASVGMMFLVSSENLLMIFVALELTSLSLYILTAFNKRNINSAEAALKYFLFGGMSAAVTLFGLSLVYGLTGELNLSAIGAKLRGQTMDPLFLLALVMSLAGFGFKVAAVPFHLWAPDAYQGAPTPCAALIASGSKVASFFILTKILLLGFAGAEGMSAIGRFIPGWMPVIAVLAVLSMLLGNVAAIAQSSIKRLLAYSAIAHAGYMFLAILASGHQSNIRSSLASLIFYVAIYGLTTIGAFAVVGAVEDRRGNETLSSFAGLSRQAPLLSLCMMIFMLSLAGIPPLAGFFGKFYIFAAAIGAERVNLGLLWLVILAIAMSAVSLYYYLQVLKQIYVTPAPEGSATSIPVSEQWPIILLAALVVVLGCAPSLLLNKINAVLAAMAW